MTGVSFYKNDISARVSVLNAQIDLASQRVNRSDDKVTIVAVSKTLPAERVVEAARDGQFHFGENRVQEAAEKIPMVTEMLDKVFVESRKLKWHLVGRLQSNKAQKAAALFDYVHSIDDYKTAAMLGKGAEINNRIIKVFVQVNTSHEDVKGGISEDEVNDFVTVIGGLTGIKVIGLMTMGPLTEDKTLIRDSFRRLRQLRDEFNKRVKCPFPLRELSMGMSGDFEIAVEEGATFVRIGTAVFGLRVKIPKD